MVGGEGTSSAARFECVVVGGVTVPLEYRPSSLAAYVHTGGFWVAQVPCAPPQLAADLCMVVKCMSSQANGSSWGVVEMITDSGVEHVGQVTHATSLSCTITRQRLVEMGSPSFVCIRVVEQPIPPALRSAEALFDAYMACMKAQFLNEYHAYLGHAHAADTDMSDGPGVVSEYMRGNHSTPHSETLTIADLERWLQQNMGRVQPSTPESNSHHEDTLRNGLQHEDQHRTPITDGAARKPPVVMQERERLDFTALSHCRMPWHDNVAHERTDQLGSLIYSIEGIRGLDLANEQGAIDASIDLLADSRHGMRSLQL